ncbi:MAG: hypothetical protein OXU20_17725, partial [Myxococcales bacterium]|nr:hypothetical protein [Myxococcales bacterium]
MRCAAPALYLALLSLGQAACASSAVGPPATPTAGRHTPATDGDPPAHAPLASTETAGIGTATPPVLIQTGASSQARTIALRMVAALLAGDALDLERVFLRRVMRTSTGRSIDRGALIEKCLGRARLWHWQRSTAIDDVVAQHLVRTLPARRDRARRGLTHRDYDFLVVLPLQPWRGWTRQGMACLPTLFVRLTPSPAIVGVP